MHYAVTKGLSFSDEDAQFINQATKGCERGGTALFEKSMGAEIGER